MVLALLVSNACGLSAPNLPTPSDLRSAQTRAASDARSRLRTALTSPNAAAFELAVLLAAEERTGEAVDLITAEVEGAVDSLAKKTRERLRLAPLLGGDPQEPRTIATAVSRVLFGSIGAGDDDGEPAFFKGSSQVEYYNPDNSFVDCVLERRQGIPITLSLVYAEVCSRLGLQMVGLNAPAHLLIAPADPESLFVVDPFAGGALISEADASQLVANNAGHGDTDRGRILLQSLRKRPMTPHMWAARQLRNLRANHEAQVDIVRTLGAAERLRLVAAVAPGASTPLEQLDCAVQQVICVWLLQWKERRVESHDLLKALIVDDRMPYEDRLRLEELLTDVWWSGL